MLESLKHSDLVQKIYVVFKGIIPVHSYCFVCIDSIESVQKPPKINSSYIPDLYYFSNNLFLIGEAKTTRDLSREHSIEQYKCFLDACLQHKNNSSFILGVEWNDFVTAKNMLRKLKKQYGYDAINITVVNDFGLVNTI